MTFLLDTHLLLWTAEQSPRLPRSAASLIDDPQSELMFSAASLWEVSIKHSEGRSDFRVDPRVLRRRLFDNAYAELGIDSEHGIVAGGLPGIHRDPFDRLLVAQSMVEGIVLLTVDPVVARYGSPVRLVS